MFTILGIAGAVALGYYFAERQYQAYLDARLPPDFDSKVKRRKQ